MGGQGEDHREVTVRARARGRAAIHFLHVPATDASFILAHFTRAGWCGEGRISCAGLNVWLVSLQRGWVIGKGGAVTKGDTELQYSS